MTICLTVMSRVDPDLSDLQRQWLILTLIHNFQNIALGFHPSGLRLAWNKHQHRKAVAQQQQVQGRLISNQFLEWRSTLLDP